MSLHVDVFVTFFVGLKLEYAYVPDSISSAVSVNSKSNTLEIP